MSLFQWPFKRKTYPGVGNPRFVDDVLASNEAVIDAIKSIIDNKPGDFFILSGLDFTAGTPGTYDPGVVLMNGDIYAVTGQFSEGLYLVPSLLDVENQPFDDLLVRPIYTLQQSSTSSSNTSFSPQFSGNMNAYRYNIRNLGNTLAALGVAFAALGTAAHRNVGVTAGTVAAGDDPRFGYTQAQIDSLFAKKIQVLLFGNTTPFTPILDYEPATKKYVDTAGGMKLRWCGIIFGDGTGGTRQAGDLNVTVAHPSVGVYNIGHNLGSANYFVTGLGYSSTPAFSSPRVIQNLNSGGFTVLVSDDASPNDWPFQLQIVQFFP